MRDSSIFIVDGIWEDVVEGLSGNIDPIPLSRHGVHEAEENTSSADHGERSPMANPGHQENTATTEE